MHLSSNLQISLCLSISAIFSAVYVFTQPYLSLYVGLSRDEAVLVFSLRILEHNERYPKCLCVCVYLFVCVLRVFVHASVDFVFLSVSICVMC